MASDTIARPGNGPATTDNDASPYDVPDRYEDLDEEVGGATGDTLDDIRRGEAAQQQHTPPEEKAQGTVQVSRLATQLYTLSHLVLFSLLGTLARVGLSHLTTYPGAPTIFPTLWANVGGSLVMGFLTEDRKLFRHEWGATSTYDQLLRRARAAKTDNNDEKRASIDLAAAKRAHLATKKTIPLYIGLATGFCGSFTSFSTFIRDVFLALSNDMVSPDLHGLAPPHRNGGYSFMALLAVVIETVGLSVGAYVAGMHLGAALEPHTPSIPFRLGRGVIDKLAVLLGWGCWLGAVLLAIFPPHDRWRGTVVFALVFAPLGCLARFYLSMLLNSRRPSFPLGTFAANMLGTAVLGMAWDIAHSTGAGGVLGCQLLQGIEDGFCGCLTTVSTWVSELSSLRRKSAYIYGTVSVVLATVLMIVIMGSLRWTQGFAPLQCHP
ncbi:CrcB-like protein [Akanthomyces lecanii RCEF 1005]|uniref:CrcB-like protein n=1 Tax=Akanthomyces lecanii RCEF 1005 TaxID=1081108 RepID=A0A168F6D7_CORDF|nr:CrcB-like protein [Akanthomyces lecanii RCEF 1005]